MNEILEQFKIVFNLDNKPLEQGLKQSESMLKTFGKTFAGLAATYLSFQTIKGVIDGFAAFNQNLSDSARLSGVSTESLQTLGGALKRYGGSVESASASLKGLQKHMNEAKKGGGALVEVARKYGISINAYSSSDKALKSLAQQMDKLSDSQKIAVANSLGFDDALTKALLDGSKNLDRLINKQKELGVSSAEDIKKAKQFNEAWNDLQDTFSALTRDIGSLLIPVMTKIVSAAEKFVGLIKDHKPLVVGIFAAIAVAMAPVILGFVKIAAASVAAFAPIYAVIGVIVGIALILEDIYYYFKGYDSVTGDLVKKFPTLGKILEYIRPIVVGIFESFENILKFIEAPSWESFKAIFTPLLDGAKEFLELIGKGIMGAVNSLLQKFPLLAKVLEPLKEIVLFVWDKIKAIIGLMDNVASVAKNALGGVFDSIGNLFSSKDSSKEVAEMPQAQMPNSNVYHNTSTQQSNNVNVQNTFNNTIQSNDPVGFANATQREMIKSVNDIQQQIGRDY